MRDKKGVLNLLLIFILIPAILVFTVRFGERQYYLISISLMMLALLVFLLSFERRIPSPRELVTLAVMTAIAVMARVAFIMVPNIKPITGMVMITGICLGPGAGFIAGAISAFVSNFFLGQGPWTPWQMFAYGLSGFLMGLLTRKGLVKPDRRVLTAVTGALIVLCLIGPLLDTCTLFIISPMLSEESIAVTYAAGLPVNIIHALSTFLTLFFLCGPIRDKLERIRVKYGLME